MSTDRYLSAPPSSTFISVRDGYRLERRGGHLSAVEFEAPQRGKCECGCGGEAPRYPHSSAKRGEVKGEPARFKAGHQRSGTGSFLAKRVDRGHQTECWSWLGKTNAGGYGVYAHRGSTMLAHRAAYEVERGPIPAGMQIDHLCRQRDCINPDHLEAVTPRENSYRGVGTKLSDEQVAEIRASNEPHAVLAARYNTGKSYISKIKCGVERRNLEDARNAASYEARGPLTTGGTE